MAKKADTRIYYQNGKTKISGPSGKVLFLIWFHEIRTTLLFVVAIIGIFVTTGKSVIAFVWEWIKRLQLLILFAAVVDFLLMLSG